MPQKKKRAKISEEENTILCDQIIAETYANLPWILNDIFGITEQDARGLTDIIFLGLKAGVVPTDAKVLKTIRKLAA